MQQPGGRWEALVWEEDLLTIGDLVFHLHATGKAQPGGASDHFVLYKSKALICLYERFFAAYGFRPENIFELGLWDGGSAALWFELLGPKKHVAIDRSERGDSEYFTRWVATRGLETRMKTYWGTDQSNAKRLEEIVQREFDGPLDLVIDDASHQYRPTKASFEAIFPLLRRGGIYIIEDWQWEHGVQFAAPDHPWANQQSLTSLVFELVEATGTSAKGSIAMLTVCPGFVAVERGWMQIEDPAAFTLAACISRRPATAVQTG
jgi:predicted O-methyltransferase YrrM